MDNLIFLSSEAYVRIDVSTYQLTSNYNDTSSRWSSSTRRKVYIARLEAYIDNMVAKLKENGVTLLSHEDLRWADTVTLKIAHVCSSADQIIPSSKD